MGHATARPATVSVLATLALAGCGGFFQSYDPQACDTVGDLCNDLAAVPGVESVTATYDSGFDSGSDMSIDVTVLADTTRAEAYAVLDAAGKALWRWSADGPTVLDYRGEPVPTEPGNPPGRWSLVVYPSDSETPPRWSTPEEPGLTCPRLAPFDDAYPFLVFEARYVGLTIPSDLPGALTREWCFDIPGERLVTD